MQTLTENHTLTKNQKKYADNRDVIKAINLAHYHNTVKNNHDEVLRRRLYYKQYYQKNKHNWNQRANVKPKRPTSNKVVFTNPVSQIRSEKPSFLITFGN